MYPPDPQGWSGWLLDHFVILMFALGALFLVPWVFL